MQSNLALAISRNKISAAALCPVMIVAIYAVALYLMGGEPRFPLDDPYIFLHNAQVLLKGSDAAFPGVPALAGSTSAIYLLLVAGLSLVTPATIALYLASMVGAISYVLGVYRMGEEQTGDRRLGALLAAVSTILAGSVFQLLNGADTGLAMAAVAWDLALLISPRKSLALPILCGLMPFVRPELAILGSVSMLAVLADKNLSAKFKAVSVAASVAAFLPFAGWYWLAIRVPFPATASAKMYFFAETFCSWPQKLALCSPAIIIALEFSFPLFVSVWFIRPRPVRRVCFTFTALMIGAYFALFPGSLAHNYCRYLFVFAPIIVLGVASGISGSALQQRLTLVMLAIFALILPITLSATTSVYIGGVQAYWPSIVEVTDWANANLPEGSRIAIHDAGYIGYAGKFELFDLVGLKTPAAIDVNKRLTWPSNGARRGDAIAELCERFRPSYLIVTSDWDRLFGITWNLYRHGWVLTPLFHSRFGDFYQVYRLQAPQG